MAKGKGGQKIKMVKMENKSHLQVTFSKRRTGLFNKATELCTLTDAKVLLIVFSPSKRVYCYGHPCAERLMEQFLSCDNITDHPKPYDLTTQYVEAQRDANVHDLNIRYAQLMDQLEEEKKRATRLKKSMEEFKGQGNWCGEIDEFDMDQLLELKASIMEFKRKMAAQAGRVLARAPFSGPPPPPLEAAFGGPSSSNVVVNNGVNPLGSGGGFNGQMMMMMPQPYNNQFGYGYGYGYGGGFQ